MYSYNEFDNIKAEKAKAMKNYQRKLKLKTFLYFLELCFVLAFFSSLYNSIPIVKDYVKSLVIRVFHKISYEFLLTNVIVFALAISFYVESECNEGKESVYDEYVNVIKYCLEFTASEPENVDDKPVIYSDNNQNNVVDEVKRKRELRRSETYKCRRAELEAMSSEEFKSTIERFIAMQKMTQLEELKKEGKESVYDEYVNVIESRQEFTASEPEMTGLGRKLEAVKRKRELRRSETYKCRRAELDAMSSEEFKSTIERFIAMQKMTQLEELKKEGIRMHSLEQWL